MPYPRKTPLVTGEIYHVFNKGIDGRITFKDEMDLDRAVKTARYYRFSSTPMKLSQFLDLNIETNLKLEKNNEEEKIVSVICYCIMPNHFHFTLKQEIDGGISKFISQFVNSYTRYFNTKNKRIGQLFLDRFRNVLIETDSQALHLSRYIHLNPYSSGVVNSLEELRNYRWSSLSEYLGKTTDIFCDKDIVLSNFSEISKYEKFVLDRADYQRELKRIENLIVD
jgi:putative transposase